MVGFRDFVGTYFAPVSNKTAVKENIIVQKERGSIMPKRRKNCIVRLFSSVTCDQ